MEDRRIRKTKTAFYKALIQLLKKDELRNISIQELCDLADSHRSTFYYHYADIYALYEEMENRILGEFASTLSAGVYRDYPSMYEAVIDCINKNLETWTVLLDMKSFHRKVCDLLEEKFLEIWQYETGRKKFSPQFHILLKASAAGFVSLFTQYLNSDEDYPDEMIKSLLGDMDDAFDMMLEKNL